MHRRWRLFLCFIVFPIYLSCALPPQAGHQSVADNDEIRDNQSRPSKLAQKIIPPQIVPSTRVQPSPKILGVNYVGTIGGPGQGAGQFIQPFGLALDRLGHLYVADSGNNRIQVVDLDGDFITEFGSRGWRIGEFDQPTATAINLQRTEILYVIDTGNSRVQYCNLVDRIFHHMLGNQLDDDSGNLSTGPHIDLDLPNGIGIGRNGEIYVVDTGNNRFIQFDSEGRPVLSRGSFGAESEQFRDPTHLVVDPHGYIYVVDSGNHRVKKYDFSANLVQIWGSEGSALGQFQEPSQIALDRWNSLYVTDRGNRRVQIFTPNGEPLTEFGSDSLVEPVGIVISRDDRVFVSDFGTNDIKVFQVIFRP